jgi:glycosyltransferase involved in cell wall biosynthesis
MRRKVRLIGAAFGDVLSERTFSGVSKNLFDVLAKQEVMLGYISTKQIHWVDLITGAMDFSKYKKFGRPGINESWLWKKNTIDKLTERFQKQLDSGPECDAVLQVGTHVYVRNGDIKHYCLTDMTVAQSVQSKFFLGNCLTYKQAKEAIAEQKLIFDNCNGIFVNSRWVKESIVRDYLLPQEKIHIVGVGASMHFDINNVSMKEKCNILFVGIDWDRKGGEMLLEAFYSVRKKIKDVTLTIIGNSPAISDSNVKVLGKLDKTVPSHMHNIQDAFCKASLLCVPSLFEPFGICFLEAQLFKVPPVTFEGEGRRDAIIDGVTGVLVKERTSEALSEAILGLLNNPEKIRKMGEAGREFVKKNYTWGHIANRILTVIQNQVGGL